MRDVRLDNLTDLAAASFEGLADTRQRTLVTELVKRVHAYARDMQLTHDEWRGAIAFLHRMAEISSPERSEFTLLSDVVGLSSLVDLLGSRPGATPGSVLGPFHTVGSPWQPNPADLVRDNAGERVTLRGRVCDTAGTPLPEATIDFWQNAANGLYWQVDPTQPSDNLRGQLRVDAEGGFAIRTIRPVPYQIPTDGPVWKDLVEPAGRTAWRPAHYHLIVSAPGHRTLVTELFDEEDPWLDRDAVFGVREALVGRYEATAEGPVMQMEFRLAPG